MSEKNLLPCPVCGYNAEVYENSCVTGRKYVSCQNNECDVSGPFADDKENAVEKWNAMPRALKWTIEPPTVEGWYFVKTRIGSNIIFIGCDSKIFKAKSLIDDVMVAGPISEPEGDKKCPARMQTKS